MLTNPVPTAPKDRLVWDMVFPLAPSVGNTFDVLDRFHQAGHGFVSLTIAGDDCGLAEAIHRLAGARAAIARRPETFRLATSVEDILSARRQGKLAVGLHLEGTECLERDPDVLEAFYSLGIRHGILAFNQNNSASGGCADVGNVGLSRLGRRYLDRMSQVGMLLDVSHMSERSSLEAIDHIGRPVVFTHSNARAVHDHYRNVTDEQAKACAATGGLVGVSGSSAYIGPADDLAHGLFRHIDHLVSLVGGDHVGLGTDYVVDADAIMRIFAGRPDEWPTDDGVAYNGLSYLAPERLWDVVALMDSAGYPETTVAGILGQNYVRIALDVWK
jgi:membrane dipeptidase